MTTMTNNTLPTIPTPHLDADSRAELLEALQAHLDGAKVTISVEYNKVTSSKPRIEGEDYRGLLGVDRPVLIGTVKKVSVGKKGPYILLDATLTRQPLDGNGQVTTETLGWTSIKGEGIKVLKGTRTEAKTSV